MSFDDRIPLRFADPAELRGDEALLWEDGPAASPVLPPVGATVARFQRQALHRPGCRCCGGRGPAATALAELFRNRARGQVAWFTGVIAVVGDPAAVAAELAADVLVAARFRLDTPGPANTTR